MGKEIIIAAAPIRSALGFEPRRATHCSGYGRRPQASGASPDVLEEVVSKIVQRNRSGVILKVPRKSVTQARVSCIAAEYCELSNSAAPQTKLKRA